MGKYLVEMKNVNKTFGSIRAVKDIDFNVSHGEVRGLVGDNGAGKSTLIKILGGYTQQDTGKIVWGGKEVHISSVQDALRLGIETLYQDHLLMGDLTIAENIFLGREFKKTVGPFKFLNYSKMRKEATRAMQNLGLNLDPDRRARFCSGGERQGIGLARAMYFRSKLVILDEPTTALSVRGVQTVLDFIRRTSDKGVSCIVISHNLNHLLPVADTISIMYRGRIVDTRKKEEISEKEIISLQLFGKVQ